MTTASPSKSDTPTSEPGKPHDPDQYRMTIGEHLEDLRRRLIFGLIGFVVAMVVCVAFTERVIVFFTAPYVTELVKHHLNPQMYYRELTEVFMTYLKIWMISAAALAGPWMIYQIWQFVAAGLYPHERKMVTRYIPMSIILLLTGMVFVYFVVLPMTVSFFLSFGGAMPLPGAVQHGSLVDAANYSTMHLPVLPGDPRHPSQGEIWINSVESRIKTFYDGNIHVMLSGADSLLTPMLTLSDYIDLVLTFMITFGIAFQLPLVVLALVALNIVQIDMLKKQRRIIYFVMAIASAILAPGDILSSMLSLLIPLLLLYELGLWMAQWRGKKTESTVSAD